MSGMILSRTLCQYCVSVAAKRAASLPFLASANQNKNNDPLLEIQFQKIMLSPIFFQR